MGGLCGHRRSCFRFLLPICVSCPRHRHKLWIIVHELIWFHAAASMLAVAAPAVWPLCTEHTGWHHHHIDKAIINPHLLHNINDKIRTKDTMRHNNNHIHHIKVLPVPTVANKRVESSYNNLHRLIMAENKYMRRPRDHHQALRIRFARWVWRHKPGIRRRVLWWGNYTSAGISEHLIFILRNCLVSRCWYSDILLVSAINTTFMTALLTRDIYYWFSKVIGIENPIHTEAGLRQCT